MNSLIDSLNAWGGRFVDFALAVLWQSSLLITVVLAFDFLLRRKVRAAVRYSLWFVIFVKLLVPPTLALPTGAAWWLRDRTETVTVRHTKMVVVDYREPVRAYVPPAVTAEPIAPPAPTISRVGWMLLGASLVAVLLSVWVVLRWRQIAQYVRQTAEPNSEIANLLSEARRLAGLRRKVTLRITAEAMSPAVCGLFRPVILLPQSLIEKLTANQIRAVLLHELIHLRRCDVWVNCAQTLLQIVYWWHPLLWIANARVRRVREEAVDDAVMCALNAEAEVYAPTLLEVAKLAFARPLASLGLVGILESRSALRHRIERLLNFTTPRRAGVSVISVICLAAFTALAVPMGEPPARPAAATDELAGEKLIAYRAKVDSEVFTRNIQARAERTMHTTNDDLNDILVSVLDSYGVDCSGDRAIQFDPAAGVLTAKNTSEALGVLDEVVKELNLKGGEHVLNPPHGLKQVLIEGQFYLMKPEEVAKLPLVPNSLHHEGNLSPWWELSPADTANVRQQLKNMGINLISAGRIQTSHGIDASLFTGDGTNDMRMDCVPYVRDGVVEFTALARTTGKYAPAGKDWPDIAGHTNCAIFTRITVPNGGAGILRAQQAGADRDLIIVLSAKIVEPAVKTNVPFLRDLPGVGPLFHSPANARSAPAPDGELYTYTFRLDLETLTARLKQFAEKHPSTGITSNPAILTDFLANAGVDTYPEKSFFYREENGRANLTLHTTQEQLRKAAQALGLDWKTEQALNDGKSTDIDKLQQESKPPMHYDRYKIDSNSPPASNSSVEVSQLVQDGKLLYQLGKNDEALLKLEEALAKDPNNQAAQYYMTLLKQTRARNLAPPQGGRGINVPGPGARPDSNDTRVNLPVPNPYARTNTIHTSPQRQQLYEKLNSIVFDKIAFPNLPLDEVIRTLSEQTQRRDIDQLGINFIMNKTKPLAAQNMSVPGATPVFDPTTGAPIPAAGATAEDVDLAAVTISLEPGLRNVRLLDVLEAITKSADHPISYSLLDYGIEFRLKGSEQVSLHTRTFKVDPNTFYMGMQNFITFNAGRNQPPAANQSNGSSNGLHSTTEIQMTVIGFFNSIGVNLAAPKSVFFNDRQGTLTVRATDEDLELIEQAINTLNIAPPQVTVTVRTVEVNGEDMFKPEFDWFLEMVTRNTMANPAGIITEPQFRTLLKKIKQGGSADLLNEMQVTTLSGRQAQLQLDLAKATNGFSSNYFPGVHESTNSPLTLDIVPYVGADGYTIQMTLIPTETQFIDYPPPANIISTNGGIPITGNLPLPRSRVRQTVMSCIVWDGQTVVLLPKPYVAHQKNLVIFVTPVIIDPSGNRKNSDESLQFAQKTVPPQTAH